ncbi:hypothetical protein GCM10010401_11920 [Rarobacter faecitabidus]|nr:hypothetical protein [Rarobacter faecitabidus]
MKAASLAVSVMLLSSMTMAGTAQAREVVVARTAEISFSYGDPPVGSPKVESVQVRQDVTASTVTSTIKYETVVPSGDITDTQVYFGTFDGTVCRASFAMAGRPGQSGHHAAFLPSTAVTSSITVSGTTTTVRASGNAKLGSTKWTCVYFVTVKEGTSYQTGSWERLDEQSVEIPELAIQTDATVAAKNGKWAKVKVKVQNASRATAKNVTVKLSGSKLKLSAKTVKFSSIGPWKVVTKTIKVRLTGNKTRKLKIKANVPGGVGDSSSVQVLRYKKTTTLKSLAGRYFWGADSSLDQAWQPRGVYFVNKKWAYVGVPAKGLPKKCKTKKKECQRYTYNAKTGKVKVGKSKGTVDSKGLNLKVDKANKYYWPAQAPKKGSRLHVSLRHQGASGCGYGFGKICHTYTWYLTLGKNGKFSEASQSTTNWSVPTDGWYVGSNDTKGKYRILGGGRIELKYANGKKVIRTIAVFTDAREKPSPRYEGLLLGGTKYYY